MDIFKNVGAKLRGTNEARAAAQKSWRDDRLTVRGEALSERERAVAAQESSVAARLDDLKRIEARLGRQRLKYGTIGGVASVAAFLVGVAAGSHPISSVSEVGKDKIVSAAPASPEISPTVEAAPVLGSQDEEISVPSDSGAQYKLISWNALPNGNREAVTFRHGPSGDSYARREIDCSAMTFRYLGEGTTLSEASVDHADASMGALTPESISTYVAEHVCSK
jgi:hypothetical protein